MSNDAGDASSRLSDALDEIFSGASAADPGADDAVSTNDAPAIADGAYELPEIVPATVDPPTPQMPRLPDAGAAVAPPAAADPAATAGPTPSPSPTAPTAPSWETTPTAANAPTARPAGWTDFVTPASASAAGQLRAPGRRPRVRRVTRVLRHIDPWSTFKLALVFSMVAYVVSLTSGVLLWRVADSTGTLDNVERWFTQFGWETFELKGGEIYHNAWIIGLFGVVAATGGAVLLVTLFNLVSDIVGGVRMTVLEEEVVERTVSSTRRYVVRRPGGVAGAAAAPDWSADDLDDDEASTADASGPATATVDAATEPLPRTDAEPPAADWSVD